MLPPIPTATKMRIARLLGRGVRGLRALGGRRDPFVEVERHGATLRLDLREGVDLAVFLGLYERRTYDALARECRPGSVILDIGANIGVHALPLAAATGADGRVVAIEPTDYGQKRLTEQLALNPGLAKRVTPVQAFLASSEHAAPPAQVYARWTLEDGPPAGERHPRHGGATETTTAARTVTLDQLVQELGLARVDLVKMDIDGHECDALQGASRLLGTLRPTFVAELCPHLLEENGGSGERLLGAFLEAKYALRALDGKRPLGKDVAGILRGIPRGASVDFVAVPT